MLVIIVNKECIIVIIIVIITIITIFIMIVWLSLSF